MPSDARSPDSSPADPGDPCRAEHGASLPPRKRLLAGLKQNGWLSCPSSYASSWQSTGAPCAGLLDEVNLEVDLDVAKMDDEPPKLEAGSVCMSHSGDGTIAHPGDEIMDSNKSMNGTKQRKSFSPAEALHGSVESLSQMTRSSHNRRQFRKKAKASRPTRSCDLASAASSFSHQERAAAAKLTAAMAAKTAAEARAVAANKAAAAAKAAAVAKAALEAVALVARDEDSKPRRNSIRRQLKPQISGEKHNSKETILKPELQSASQIPPPLDDEEFARELHRAMNSSPRISRSRSSRKEDGPVIAQNERRFQGNYQRGKRRSCSLKDVEKQEIKTARLALESVLSSCAREDVKSKSTISVNDTIPTDSVLQKAELLGENFSGDFASASPGCEGLAGKLLTPQKEESIRSCEKWGKRSRKKYIDENHISPTERDGGSIIESNPTSKNESVYSNNDMGSNTNFEDWAATNPDMVDVERSVNQGVSMVRDVEGGGIRNCNHKISSESSLVACGNEVQDMSSERDSRVADKESVVSTDQPLSVCSNASEKVKLNGKLHVGKPLHPDMADLDIRAHEVRDAEIPLIGEAEPSGLSIHSVRKESSVPQGVLKSTVCDNKSKGVSKNMLQSKHVHGEGQTWQQGVLKGLPKGVSTGKETFGGSLSLTTFRSATPVSIQTPAFARGPTASHS